MTRHLLYLLGCSARNRLLRQARRLRTPRYAAAVVVGLAYFYFAFGGFRFGRAPTGAGPEPILGLAAAVGPLALALVTAWWWLRGGRESALRLSPAETHLLLPAPVTRRQIILLKLMQAQAGIVVSAGIGTILMREAVLPWPLRLASLWLMISTLHLHQVAASLVRLSAEQQGRVGLRRQAAPLALFGVMFGALAAALIPALAQINAERSLDFALDRLGTLLHEPAPATVLAPFRLLMAPIFAESLSAWAPAFAGAAVLMLLHYLWLQRTDAAFEEAAAEAGARQAALADAVRSGGIGRARFFGRRARDRAPARPWLPIQPLGHPAYAVFWKNVLYVQRLFTPLTAVLLGVLCALVIALAAASADNVESGLRAIGTGAFGLGAMLTVFGPIAVRNDLRTDLRHVDLLRTWPISGRSLVAAEIAAATVVITSVQILLFAASAMLLAAADAMSPLTAVGALGAAALLAPVFNALGVCLQNAVALLFPGWVRLGEQAGGGVEDFGQNIMLFVATFLLLLVALAPALLVGGTIAAQLTLQAGASPAAAAFIAGAAALGAIATIAAEVVAFTYWLGMIYDTTDVVKAGLLTR